MIHVHLADRGTTTFTGDFRKAYEAAQAYIRDNTSPSAEIADDDRHGATSRASRVCRLRALLCRPHTK